MTRKTRIFALMGLLLALAAGATAIGARPDGPKPDDFNAFLAATEGANVRAASPKEGCDAGLPPPARCSSPCCPVTGAGATKGEEKAAEKCCCPPGKPCANCPCREQSQADCGTNERTFCPPFVGCMPGGPGGMMPPMMPPGVMGPQIVPPMMPPQAYYPWAGPQCSPVCAPYPEPFPAPAPNLFCAAIPPQEPKTYIVVMKLIEQGKDKKPNIVAMPKMCVVENQTAQFSNGTSHADLWEMGVPANDFGHEGYQISLAVIPDKPGHVRVTCWVWTSELGEKSDTDTNLHESRCYTTRIVELGKMIKFDCDRLYGSHGVRCHLEMTIQEEHAASVCAPPSPRMYGSTEPCERPVGYMCYPPIAPPADRCTPPSAPATVPTMRFTTVEARTDSDPMTDAQGKLADVKGIPLALEVTCNQTKMTCQKMDLKQRGCQELCVSVEDGQVHLKGYKLTACADTVTTGPGGVVVLEGHVRVNSADEDVDVKAGKVRIELNEITQTGVISSPAPIQN